MLLRRAIPVCALGAGIVLSFPACSTIPTPEVKKYSFPKESVHVDDGANARFDKLGVVRTKVNFNSLNPEMEEDSLCRNYYNRAAADLLKKAKKEFRADAVIRVRSVIFFMDGTSKLYDHPECADDGGEGQILLVGEAIRYRKEEKTEGKSP